MTNQVRVANWTESSEIGFPLLVVAAFLLMSLSVSHVAAQDDGGGLVGSWQVTIQSDDDDKQSIWNFTRSSDRIEGTIKSVDEEPDVELKDIKLEGDAFSFNAKMEFFGLELVIVVEGQIKNGKLTGEWTAIEADGDESASGEFIGEKIEEDDQWIQLFNGKDLAGWKAKIRGHKYGDNYADTFRVKDGVLTVAYEDYKSEDFLSMDGKKEPKWEKFGHLFYKDTFSHYILRAEYRFVGDQVANGPGWAFRNNGFMIHGQDPAAMDVNQKFPVSIEAQLLGGGGVGDRPTNNLCTPGTNVVIAGKLFKQHCTTSTSATFHGDQWVTVEIEVRGNEVIRHKVDGKTVLEYTKPQYDERDAEAKKLIVDGELMISEGTISIQSESHPTEFRKIELKVLDPKAK